MKTEKVQTSIIRIDGGTQVRDAIHTETVNEYAEAMKAKAEFPPLTLFRDKDGALWLADGFHRLYAARAAGIGKIGCHIRAGSQRDALLWAAGANAEHGLRRTNADKRRAVMLLLTDPEWSKWSNRRIAEACGVSHFFVNKVKDEVESDSTPDTSNRGSGAEKRVRYVNDPDAVDTPDAADFDDRPSADGPSRGGAGLLDDRRIDDPEVGDQEHEEAVAFGPAPGKPPPAKFTAVTTTSLAPVVDAQGRPLPEKFRPVFEDGVARFDEALSLIAQAKRHIDGMLTNGDGLQFFLGAKRITADLKNLRSEIEAGKPYSLCPTCAARGCKACDGKGWVNRIMYEHAGESTVRLFEKKQWGSKA